jgi:hypothetical protein
MDTLLRAGKAATSERWRPEANLIALDDFLGIAKCFLALAFDLFFQALGLLLRAVDGFAYALLHLASDVLGYTFYLIGIHMQCSCDGFRKTVRMPRSGAFLRTAWLDNKSKQAEPLFAIAPMQQSWRGACARLTSDRVDAKFGEYFQ